jgi:hypothetical protein
LIWGKDGEEHDQKLEAVLEKTVAIGLKLNKNKVQIASKK